ncbi:MAG: polyprenyl synthetase family protein [Chitinophagales bacterium]|nr:polyprenyl synthetase family protein [Chitinophagales bacterium]
MKSYTELVAMFEKYYAEQSFDERYDVYRAMQYIMAMSSKRIRPALTLMGCDLFNGNLKTALPAALAVEVYHNSTLVHDDIMDKATTRRGNPTVHKIYGNNVAINTGDMMFTQSYGYLGKIKKDNIQELFAIFNDTVVKVIEGQSKDMEFETRDNVSETEYLEMIKGKTSVLLAGALQMGAWIADADKKSQKNIYEFGLNLGLSFQIHDDFLDAYGDPKKVGKRAGGDIILNKKTILLLKAIELANPTQRKKIAALLTEKDKRKKVKEILVLMEQTGAKKYTEDLIDAYYKKAIKNLTAITAKEENKKPLFELAHLLRNREK